MRLAIDARLHYRLAQPYEILLRLEAASAPDQRVVRDRLEVSADDLARWQEPATGERIARLTACGDLHIAYTAEVEVSRREGGDLAEVRATRIRDLPPAVLPYLMPSRYCPSDRFESVAQRRFGGLEGGEKVAAILAFVADHLDYDADVSDAFTTASDTFVDGAGVCRDYAHLAITLCRAADIPARAVSAYAWRLDPPDLHAVVEIFLGGRWRLFDPTERAPVDGLVRIATGRDAADIAFMNIFGRADLVRQSFEVTRLDLPGTMAKVADGVGFEPTVSFHPRRFSRPLP
jgi:transglutaminase-like putative cysteine protease